MQSRSSRTPSPVPFLLDGERAAGRVTGTSCLKPPFRSVWPPKRPGDGQKSCQETFARQLLSRPPLRRSTATASACKGGGAGPREGAWPGPEWGGAQVTDVL